MLGGGRSHVGDSTEAHRRYSTALTHRPRNGTDADGEGEGGAREGGGGGGNPQQEDSGNKKTALCSGPVLHK